MSSARSISSNGSASPNPRELLGRYFDISYRHRAVTNLLLLDLAQFNELGFVERVLDWRRRLMALLVGPDPASSTGHAP